MMKKLKNYLLEERSVTRAYDIWVTGALVAYMIGNCYLRDKLDKVTHQKKKLEDDLDYEIKLVALQKQTMDDYQKVVEELTDKLEEN